MADTTLYKQIALEWGQDTDSHLWGMGYSPDNGEHFYVLNTTYGRKYRQEDGDRIWPFLNDKVDGTVSKQVAEQQTVITSAVAQADSAVAYANDAIEKSRVNQQAIVEINSALSDAVSDAAVARSDGLRAWEAAQSNVDLIDQNYASASAAISSARTEAIAAADEAKASASAAQADIVAVRSDVAAVQADVTANKSDVATAKSDIAVVKTNLTSQATSLSSYAAQASAVGQDITVHKSQAGQFEQDMADTKGDVSQLKASASSASVALSDAAGNISSLQASAKSYSAALSDTNSNVATVTATASELETKYADAAGDINKLQVDAKGTAQTLADAQGDIAKLKTRADGFDTEFASTNGDISKLQTDASGTKQTLTNAKSDIAVLQSRADGFDAKYADVAGDINTIKVDAKGMKQTLTDAQGNISTLQATATGFKNTLTDAQGNISTLQSDVAGLKKTTSDHAGNIATLQASAKTLTSQMSSAQGDISTLQQTASGFSSKVSGMETSLANANSKIDNITSNGGGRNLLRNSTNNGKGFQPNFSRTDNYFVYTASTAFVEQGQRYTVHADASKGLVWSSTHNPNAENNNVVLWLVNGNGASVNQVISDANTKTGTTFTWNHPSGTYYLRVNTYKADNSGYVERVMLEKGIVAHDWTPAPEDTDAKITTNSTAIEQNKKAIALKADQTTVDKANGDVALLKAQLKVQADQINTKVSSSDLDAKGYATQTYTQTQIKQTADSWNANLTSVKNGLVKSYTNLHATVDGIQAQVYNKDGSSKITQLSNLIATKVSSGDYNSQITQLKNDINLRVAKGNVVSQINQEAGGNTLIQVANGQGKLALNASSVVFSGSAFIPDAYITTLNADKLRFYDNSGNVATMSANLVQHDDDKVARTINLQYNGGYEVHASNTLGSILTMHDDTIRLAVKSSGSSGDQYSGVYAMTHYTQLSNYRSDGSAPGVFIYDDQFNILGDANGAGTSKGDMHISSPQLYLNGSSKLQAGGDHALLTIASDYTTIHADKNVWMETGNTQLHLDNSNNLEIFNKNNTNTSNYDVHLTVRGWATFTGWINCLGLTQTSRLSTKTNIERLDTARALELINSADVATYQYKQDVANGGTKRHASVIIDDVNDVARYQTPDEFISEDRSGRSDGDIVGYLMGAVQELTKKIKTLESKVG